MKKIIRLTESDIHNIIKKVLLEQEDLNPLGLKFGSGGRRNPAQVEDVKQLQQKLMDLGYLKTTSMKPTGYFGTLTQAALQKASGVKQPAAPVQQKQTTPAAPVQQKQTTPAQQKPESGYQKPVPTYTKQYCQTITASSNIADLGNIIKTWSQSYPQTEPYGMVNRLLNRYAQAYIDQGLPKEISCQIALVQIRPGYKDKNAIITDSATKQIFLFDSKGKFLGRDFMITGKNKQSDDTKKTAYALLSWEEHANKLGFKWDEGKGWVDTTGKNRKYDEELIYRDIDAKKARYLPRGIYQTAPELKTAAGYAGDKDNLLNIVKDGKILSQAIHGYYIEQPRIKAVQLARKVLSSQDDPKVNDEFIRALSAGKINLSQSYGCLNVSDDFLPKLREFGKNAYLFNIGEDKTNYLVKNGDNYLNKSIGAKACPSPKALGAEAVV